MATKTKISDLSSEEIKALKQPKTEIEKARASTRQLISFHKIQIQVLEAQLNYLDSLRK